MQNRLVAANNGLGEWMGVAVMRTLGNHYQGTCADISILVVVVVIHVIKLYRPTHTHIHTLLYV